MPRSQCTSAAFVAAGAGARTCHANQSVRHPPCVEPCFQTKNRGPGWKAAVGEFLGGNMFNQQSAPESCNQNLCVGQQFLSKRANSGLQARKLSRN